MFNNDFNSNEERLVFRNPERNSAEDMHHESSDVESDSVENRELMTENELNEARGQLSSVSTEVELQLAKRDPVEFLRLQHTVPEGQDASPAQILAVRECLNKLFTSSPDFPYAPIPLFSDVRGSYISDRRLRFPLISSTNRVDIEDREAFVLGQNRIKELTMMDFKILHFRLYAGLSLDDNSLNIDTEFLTKLVEVMDGDLLEYHNVLVQDIGNIRRHELERFEMEIETDVESRNKRIEEWLESRRDTLATLQRDNSGTGTLEFQNMPQVRFAKMLEELNNQIRYPLKLEYFRRDLYEFENDLDVAFEGLAEDSPAADKIKRRFQDRIDQIVEPYYRELTFLRKFVDFVTSYTYGQYESRGINVPLEIDMKVSEKQERIEYLEAQESEVKRVIRRAENPFVIDL
tara:strand:- start:2689 stop:3903 length:1215 start_codon:yes stop_codon:yes gene_type:complete